MIDLFNQTRSEDFKKYHEANPQVYEGFKRITFEAIRRGHKNLSGDFILNVLRWETGVSGNDDYKINNNWRSFYTRKFMREFSEHAGFFRKRKSLADCQI